MDEFTTMSVRLTRQEHDHLSQLAASADKSKGAVVRSLIKTARLVTVAAIGDMPQSTEPTTSSHAVK